MGDSAAKRVVIRLSIVIHLMAWWTMPETVSAESNSELRSTDPEKGPQGGKLLQEDGFGLELVLFERGVPPEYRVWITNDGQLVPSSAVELEIRLARLGGVVDEIRFAPEGGFLRGDKPVHEPHSFVVTIDARYEGASYRWQFENFEGRTEIEDTIAEAMDIGTSIAGAATLHQSIPAYGKLAFVPGGHREVEARFQGEIKELYVALGDPVTRGQRLALVESNESLQRYVIEAPMGGVVGELNLSVGEMTRGRSLLTVVDPGALQAELAVYPMDWHRVAVGTPVSMRFHGLPHTEEVEIAGVYPTSREDQARIFRVPVDNRDGLLSTGQFVSAQIEVAAFEVPLAVERDALQAFRDFSVVSATVGETYEVRMLELGREGREWVEVLSGISPGVEYVTDNSYIIKADIEKSGASHDH